MGNSKNHKQDPVQHKPSSKHYDFPRPCTKRDPQTSHPHPQLATQRCAGQRHTRSNHAHHQKKLAVRHNRHQRRPAAAKPRGGRSRHSAAERHSHHSHLAFAQAFGTIARQPPSFDVENIPRLALVPILAFLFGASRPTHCRLHHDLKIACRSLSIPFDTLQQPL